MKTFGRILALSLIAAVFYALPAIACEKLGLPVHLPCPSDPWETVGLEHKDRVNRLSRLSQGRLGLEFIEDTISKAEHKLDGFPVDIPILRVIGNQGIFFDSGSDKIRIEAFPLLDVVAQSLRREPPDVALFVAGHTDNVGDSEYNFDLGFRRAAAVSEALLRRGIYQASIYRVSFGEHMPIAANISGSGRARNRRVEFLFGAQVAAIVPYLERQKIEFCASEIGGTVCEKQQIVFKPERIVVEPSAERKIVEIQKEQKQLTEIKQTLSKKEFEKRQQTIEFKRQQIPVKIVDEKILITFKQ